MSEFKHVMIDLETLGTDPDCVIVSIGAVEFDPETGELGREFYRVLDRGEQENKYRRSTTVSTLAWWKVQSPAARAVLSEPGEPLAVVLQSLRDWLPKNAHPWGNGSTFDISILENAFKMVGIGCRWRYWNVRDVRTIVHLSDKFVDKKSLVVDGVAHNALDDAKHQAKYVSVMWQKLRANV